MLSGIAKLEDLGLENQRVFVRANLDASAHKSEPGFDPWLVDRLLPTLTFLAEKGAKIVVGSRFGDVRDAANEGPSEKAPSIEPVAALLAERGKLEVLVPDSATSDSVRKVVESLRPGRIGVLENLAREDDTGPGAPAFARYLASQFDAYVSDSLRALGPSSATGTVLPKLMEKKAPGLALEAELLRFARLRSQVDQPRLLIWGGNSLATRWLELETLLPSADKLFLVGVPANTMLAALGHNLGSSRVEADFLAAARTLHEKLGSRLLLPTDAIVGISPRSKDSEARAVSALREKDVVLDLGPASQDHLAQEIASAGAVIWCGAAGLYHNPVFSNGTRRLVSEIGASRAFTLVVGDDSVASARAVTASVPAEMDCLSDGGPSALALLAGKKLPGLDALRGPNP
jgi:phosphoglycerate kinase